MGVASGDQRKRAKTHWGSYLFAGIRRELTSRPGASFEVRCRSNTVESPVNCDKCFLYKELQRMGRLDLKARAGVISLTIAGGRD